MAVEVEKLVAAVEKLVAVVDDVQHEKDEHLMDFSGVFFERKMIAS